MGGAVSACMFDSRPWQRCISTSKGKPEASKSIFSSCCGHRSPTEAKADVSIASQDTTELLGEVQARPPWIRYCDPLAPIPTEDAQDYWERHGETLDVPSRRFNDGGGAVPPQPATT